ncbi:alpha-amylase family glycosyl hydrolase [Actinosynnema sp. NPDC023794]
MGGVHRQRRGRGVRDHPHGRRVGRGRAQHRHGGLRRRPAHREHDLHLRAQGLRRGGQQVRLHRVRRGDHGRRAARATGRHAVGRRPARGLDLLRDDRPLQRRRHGQQPGRQPARALRQRGERRPDFRGDFQGQVDKLDYIKGLGFSAVWITPVVLNRSDYDFHGYHGWDFHRVDPRLESPGATYQDLIDEAHAKGLKIYQDVVYNHSSRWGAKGLFQAKVFGVRDNQWSWYYDQPVQGFEYDGLTIDPNTGKSYCNGDLWSTTEPTGNTCPGQGRRGRSLPEVTLPAEGQACPPPPARRIPLSLLRVMPWTRVA